MQESPLSTSSLLRGLMVLGLVCGLAILISTSSRNGELQNLAAGPKVEVALNDSPPSPISAPRDSETGTRRGKVVGDAVKTLIQSLEASSLENLWKVVEKLKGLGKEGVPQLVTQLKVQKGKALLGCAQALLHLGDFETRELALDAIAQLIRSTKDKPVKFAAVDTLVEEGEPEDVLEFVTKLYKEAKTPDEIIPLAKALINLDGVLEAQQKLKSYLNSRNAEVKRSAALALAEMDLIDQKVRIILLDLRREPTPRGKLAAALYRNDQLLRELEKGSLGDLPGSDPKILLTQAQKKIRELNEQLDALRTQPGKIGYSSIPELAVLEEIIKLVDRSYVDPNKVDHRKLIVAAAKGMVESLDRFSAFMPPQDAKDFLTDISGEYCGIGAHVIKRDSQSTLEITKPIYGGPAYEAGLITGDRILEIDGIPTIARSPEDTVKLLKGPQDSVIKLSVLRRGWKEPKEISFKRRTITVPTVTYHLLPQKIGLLKLSQFGEKSIMEFKAALKDLEKQGLEGLIVDLRNNLGGVLPAAKSIVNLFVGQKERPMLIVRGRPDLLPTPEERTFTDNIEKHDDFPLVILINERSASASEIVSGALKDFHRAVLVGKKTYGKGTVQNLYPLSKKAEVLLKGRSRVKLTEKQYFLPSGRSIHTLRDENGKIIQKGGVEPHVEIEPRKYPIWIIDEIEALRDSKELKEYAYSNYDQLRNLVIDGDSGDAKSYPGLKEIFEKIETKADLEAARRVVRYHLRRKYEDEKGKELAGDFQDDLQLQAGILEIMKQLELDPKQVAAYKSFKTQEESKTPETNKE